MPDLDATPYKCVLAVDTSSLVQSVAVLDAGRLIAERVIRTRAGHASALLTAIDGVLRDAELEAADLDLLVVGAGPGSFTGLRIGLASLKAIAYCHGLPLFPVSSLEALARGASANAGLIVPLFDARKGQLYAAIFRRGSDGARLARVRPDAAIGPDRLADFIALAHEGSEPVTLLGEGLRRYGERLVGELEGRGAAVATLDGPFGVVRASHLATLGAERATPETIPDLATLEPNYQRASDAEIKKTPEPSAG